jgi:hypothetical protein
MLFAVRVAMDKFTDSCSYGDWALGNGWTEAVAQWPPTGAEACRWLLLLVTVAAGSAHASPRFSFACILQV